MVTGGRNMGRVGVVTHRERHDGGFNIVHIKDAIENSFATRESNVFVIGSEKPWVSLPKGKGVQVRTRDGQAVYRADRLSSSCRSPRSAIAAARTTWPVTETSFGRWSSKAGEGGELIVPQGLLACEHEDVEKTSFSNLARQEQNPANSLVSNHYVVTEYQLQPLRVQGRPGCAWTVLWRPAQGV